MIDGLTRRGFKSRADDGEVKDAQHANQLERAGERTPRPTTWFSLCRAHRLCGGSGGNRTFSPLFPVLGLAPRPRAARCGRHDDTMYATHPTDENSSRRTTLGCHGCHAPVTPRGVTPYRGSQAVYLPAGGGVTGVTARLELIARTQASVGAPTLARITRDSAVTPVTPPETPGFKPATGRKGVTPRGVTPRDPAVTPPRWSR